LSAESMVRLKFVSNPRAVRPSFLKKKGNTLDNTFLKYKDYLLKIRT
jgi:hypothetical protein